VFLLSEAHPNTVLNLSDETPIYSPSDITKLAHYSGIPKHSELADEIFNSSIDKLYEHVEKLGGVLVIREHTHSDFNTDAAIPAKSKVVDLLEARYEVKSVLTVRDPLESYASLKRNNWIHFKPQTFDEYCRRMVILLGQFGRETIVKYEDFVETPLDTMRRISALLELPLDESFEDIFSMFKVTGDSGRSGDRISQRPLKTKSQELTKEAQNSAFYKELVEQIGKIPTG
jgi:hypothetical protein